MQAYAVYGVVDLTPCIGSLRRSSLVYGPGAPGPAAGRTIRHCPRLASAGFTFAARPEMWSNGRECAARSETDTRRRRAMPLMNLVVERDVPVPLRDGTV